MKKLLSMLLVCALLLVGCNNKQNSSQKLTEYRDYDTQNQEITTLNYLTTNTSVDIRVVANFVDALLEYDADGKLIGDLAKDYSHNEDATEWTFKLRDGLKWVTHTGEVYGDVTAEDFVSGIKYILTANNGSQNVNNVTSFLKGANEYYEASKAGTATEELFKNVGVEAVDEKTVKYTLAAPKPYFDSVVTYITWFPVNQKFVDEVGPENFGTDKDKILYNGCYRMTDYQNGASKEYVKNEHYWDKKNVPFEKVTVTMLESLNKAYSMYEINELDHASLTQDEIKIQADNEHLVETRGGGRSAQIYFNYEQVGNENWNQAVSNVNFRKAWFYGVDPTPYHERTNPINPDSLMNNLYTCGVIVKDSKGTYYKDFEELKAYANGLYDEAKFKEAKEKAVEELSAQGVTFPVEVGLPYNSGNQTAEETFLILKDSIEKCLGDDFVTVTGIPYIKSATSEIYEKGLQSIALVGWAPDYNDPYDFLRHMTDTEDGYMNKNYSHISDPTYDALVLEANQIVDLDERYHAFAKAEDYYLQQAYSVPFYVDGHEIQVTRVNDYSKPYSFTSVGRKIKFWETKADGYTQEEYAKFAEEAK